QGTRCLAFSPDGNTLATGSSEGIVFLRLGHRPRRSHSRFTGGIITCIAFSPDGKTVAGGNDDGKIVLWDASTEQPLGSVSTEHPGATGWMSRVTFSPGGRLLASAGSGS